MHAMLAAAPDLYTHVDFFNSHSYPFNNRALSDPLGRAGVLHYRSQLALTGRPGLGVVLSETGWRGPNETFKAESIVAAYQQEWLPDPRVEAVLPFLLAANASSPFATQGETWMAWTENGRSSSSSSSAAANPVLSLQFNHTRQLRCDLHVGGPC